MDQSHNIILNPFNYFEWKTQMEILMRGKKIFKDTMEIETDTKITEEKIKWHNRRDDVYVLLCLIISRDLLFHLDGLTSPN